MSAPKGTPGLQAGEDVSLNGVRLQICKHLAEGGPCRPEVLRSEGRGGDVRLK
jgi:hypothetical protein